MSATGVDPDAPGRDEMIRRSVMAALRDSGAIPPEMCALVVGALEMMDSEQISGLVVDAMRARDMLAAGKKDEARALIEQHRKAAEDAGLSPVFDALVGNALA